MKGITLNAKSKKNIRVAKLFLISIIFVCIALAIALIGGNYIGNRNFKETFYSVSSLKVNNKIRIVQISDLHNSVYGKDNVKLVDRVTKLKPDLILYTGDIIDTNVQDITRVTNLCAALSKVAPSYYIYGNNEVERYYNDPLTQDSLDAKYGFNDKSRDPKVLSATPDELESKLTACGVKVLKNATDTIKVGKTNIDVFGVLTSNPSAFWPYAGAAFETYLYTNPNHLKVTAIHEPFVFEEFTPETWGDVLLAGHTHGGVVRMPMVGPLYTKEGGFLPERKGHFTYGRYDVQGRPMVVSGGMENKNIFRINNAPELVIVDVNKF